MQPMSMKLLLTVMLSGGMLVACGAYDGELPSDSTAQAAFGGLPGRIGVTIRDTNSNVWRFEIRQGKLSRVNDLPPASRSATSTGVGVEKPAGVPGRGELVAHGPFALSGDKKYVAAAMDLKPPRDSAPQHLAVVRTQGGEVVYESGKDDSYVESMAWSPDSKYVAVLRKAKSNRMGSPLDVLSAMFGHPVQYNDYRVEVIDVNGKRVGDAPIANDVKASWGEIVW